jgi:hypothetical protein
MDEEVDLSQALAYLLGARSVAGDFTRAQEMAGHAIQLASRWPDSWVSKGIRVHAHAWFFYDQEAALEVLGGQHGVANLMGSQSLVKDFTTAIGALCGQEYEHVFSSLQAGAQKAPCNPFIDFLTVVALIETRSPEAPSQVKRFAAEYSDHPLRLLLENESLPR